MGEERTRHGCVSIERTRSAVPAFGQIKKAVVCRPPLGRRVRTPSESGGDVGTRTIASDIKTLSFPMFANATAFKPNGSYPIVVRDGDATVPRRRRPCVPCYATLPEVFVPIFITVIFPSLLLLLSRDGVTMAVRRVLSGNV